MRLRENSRSASAAETFLPRMSCANRFSFCGLTRRLRLTALASVSESTRSRFFLPIDLSPPLRSAARRGALAARALGFAVGRMAVERTGRRELAELVANHFLGDDHRHMLLAVVNAERQADELRQDGRAARPDADHLVASGRTRGIRLFQQIAVDKRTLPDRTRHVCSYRCYFF